MEKPMPTRPPEFAGDGIDTEKLRAFLREKLPEARDLSLTDIERTSGGISREHFSFDLTWSDGKHEQTSPMILIRNGVGPGQTDRGNEFRVLRALDNTSVPVPKAHWCDESGDWLERPFIVMERVGGAVTPPFQLVYADAPAMRQQMMEEFVDILGDLHVLDWRELGLDMLDFPQAEPHHYARDSLAVLEALLGIARGGELKELSDLGPLIDRALDWLRAHTPRTERLCICHGDYKPDNVLHEQGRILAVVDWERAHIADPMLDLAYVGVPHLRVGDLAVGLAPMAEIVERYQERTGSAVDSAALEFWQLHLLLQTVLYLMSLAHEARQRGLEVPPELQMMIDYLPVLIERAIS
jgi:aminoglycoside phosphotransferase (APT) family kinase protein